MRFRKTSGEEGAAFPHPCGCGTFGLAPLPSRSRPLLAAAITMVVGRDKNGYGKPSIGMVGWALPGSSGTGLVVAIVNFFRKLKKMFTTETLIAYSKK
jgi:hypothetical protein